MKRVLHLRWLWFLVCLCLGAPCGYSQIDWPQLALTQVAGGLSAPIYVANARDGSGRLFIVELGGRIKIYQTNSLLPQPFLDITDRVYGPPNSVYGMFSVAFPTNYASQGWFVVFYTRTNDFASVISRFHVSTNANVADPSSEQVLLVVQQDAQVFGGMLAFGPDGYLYASTADNLDPLNSDAQNPASLQGKILRLDLSQNTNSYLIPPNNPFVSNSAYAPEIWALGLRNPFKFSFDRLTGDLYIADVGEGVREEVDFQLANRAGGQNYGWPLLEGTVYNQAPLGSDISFLTPPVAEYPHPLGIRSSITGGSVYRGTNSARMYGVYFFGDFETGKLWGLERSGTNWQTQIIPIPQHFISSFGEDESGELYLVDLVFGKVYRIADSGLAGAPVLDPPGGIVNTSTINIASSSPGVALHYTTNGAIPTTNDPVVAADGNLVITSGINLSVGAFRADLLPSTVTTTNFVLQAGVPVFSPPNGPITNGTLLTMSSASPGAAIRYSLDGSDPTANSAIYSVPFAISSTNVVSAQAYAAGFSNSPIQRVFFSGAVAFQSPINLNNGSYLLTWASETSRQYQVQFSSDLIHWTNVGAAQTGTTGQPLGYVFTPGGAGGFLRLKIN